MEAASLIRPPDSPADATPPDETLAPRPPMRKRRSSMVPVFRKPRGIAENLEKAMVGIDETAAPPRATSEPVESSAHDRPATEHRARLGTVVEQPVAGTAQPAEEDATDDSGGLNTFLVEDLEEQLQAQPEPSADSQSAGGFAALETSVLALRMKRKLTTSWKATVSVDMWYDLKRALDIPPEKRTLTHCMDIDNWISKVYILRPLRKRQRQEICKWIQYRAFETKQKIFERGDSGDGDNFYMIFSGTVAVLTPRQELPEPEPPSTETRGEDTARRPRPAVLTHSNSYGLVMKQTRRASMYNRRAYVKLLSSGDCFGELGLMETSDHSGTVKRTATVEAQSPCMLLTLPKRHFVNSGLNFAGHERMMKVRKLKTNQLFENWPLDALLLISFHCYKREFQPGDVIIDGDKENKHAFALMEGACTLRVDGATQMVTAGFSVGADTAFEEKKRSTVSNKQTPQKKTGTEKQTDQQEQPEQQPERQEVEEEEPPRRYHAVADHACMAYTVSQEMLQTLVPPAARGILAELGKFRLSVLGHRAERHRIKTAKEAAEMAKEAEKQAFVEAEGMRTREAWISAQKRAVELRPPPASMGMSPHMLLNTDGAMRDLQRAERRAHHTLLTDAVTNGWTASGPGGRPVPKSITVSGRHISLEAAVRVVTNALSTVQKLQSVVAALKVELIQYRQLLRNAGRYEVSRLAAAIERLVTLIVSAMRQDATLTSTVRRGLTWRREGKQPGSNDNRHGSGAAGLGSQATPRSTQDEARRRRAWLAEVPLFKALPPDSPFFQALAAKLTEQTVRRKVVVIEKGSIGTEMFFVVSGEAEVLASLDEPPFVTLKAGTFFGENALLTEDVRNAYVRASKTLEMYALSKTDLLEVFLEFPDVERIMQEFASAEERRKTRLKAEDEAAANEVAAEDAGGTMTKKRVTAKAKKKSAVAPARALEDIVRQLNLCSRLCTRASALLTLCVSWHTGGNPSVNKDGELAQEVARQFATKSAELKAVSLRPVEMLHQMLQRSDPRVATHSR